jgi:hypothetical protein
VNDRSYDNGVQQTNEKGHYRVRHVVYPGAALPMEDCQGEGKPEDGQVRVWLVTDEAQPYSSGHAEQDEHRL